MSDPDEDEDYPTKEEPRRFKRYRYGPVRLVTPWLGLVVGIACVVIGAGGLQKTGESNTSVTFIAGLALIVLSVVFFFIFRWMAKRGI
jgi:LPXTG-motif cell wall-anchored protein